MTNLPSLRERANQTLTDIERVFALPNVPGNYRERAGATGPAFAWAHGVLFSAFVAAAHLDKARYLPRLHRHFAALQTYWHPAGPVGGYNASRVTPGQSPDRYYDDNAWFVLAFLDAHALTGERKFDRAARAALAFVLAGYDTRTGGGLYWHEQEKRSKNTASTAPGLVGTLAVAAREPGRPEPWSVQARRLYAWLRAALRDPADGLYWDNIHVANGQIERAKWSYNSALVLRAELDLYQLWGAPVYRDRAVALADACIAHWFDPAAGLLKDDASFAHLLAEALLQTSAVTGLPRYRNVVRTTLDNLWTTVRRPDGGYPKRWDARASDNNPTELLWIASAARAYAYAAPHLDR